MRETDENPSNTLLSGPYADRLQSLEPFRRLEARRRAQLLARGTLRSVPPGQDIFPGDAARPPACYLLSGRVALLDAGREVTRVAAEDPEALRALCRLAPGGLNARALNAVEVLQLDRAALEQAEAEASGRGASGQAEGESAGPDASGQAPEERDWMLRLLHSELFARIPPGNIQRIFTQGEDVSVKAGEVVIQQGQPGDYYYVIKEGTGVVSRRGALGSQPVRLATLSPGDAFGEEALLSGSRRNASVTMSTPGSLMRLTRDDFVELIQQPVLRAVDAAEARRLVEQGGCWLDVRFPGEHRNHALPGSLNLPLNALRGSTSDLEAGRQYVVYCDSGSRSAAGAFLLSERGFKACYLKGGIGPQGAVPKDLPPSPAVMPSAPADAKAAPGQGGLVEAQVQASALQAELARASLRVQEALRQKTRAEEALRRAEEAAQAEIAIHRLRMENDARRAHEALDEARRMKAEAEQVQRSRQDSEARLQQELERLRSEFEAREQALTQAAEARQRDSREAERMVAEAERLRSDVAHARDAAEREVQRQREEATRRLQALQEEGERRLREKEARLEAAYAWKFEELSRLQQSLRDGHPGADVPMPPAAPEPPPEIDPRGRQDALRQAVMTRVKSARDNLAQAFVEHTRELDSLRRERAVADAAARQAAEQAEHLLGEYQTAYARWREEEAERLHSGRETLQADSGPLAEALRQARAAHEEARAVHEAASLALRHRLAGPDGPGGTPVSVLEASLRRAEAGLQRSARLRWDAEQAARELAEGTARLARREQRLKPALDSGPPVWMEQPEAAASNDEDDGLWASQRALARLRERAGRAQRLAAQHPATPDGAERPPG